jgi:hypothetical protein
MKQMDWGRRMCCAQILQIYFLGKMLIYWLLALSISGALPGLERGKNIRSCCDLVQGRSADSG